jgi:8-oxo-dGTP pyrophosphatase MutT (NUDIX family)
MAQISVTVAAVIQHQGRFFLVEEQTDDGVRINQPAGHLEPHESILEAAVRETLEEAAYGFAPLALIGIYRCVILPRI